MFIFTMMSRESWPHRVEVSPLCGDDVPMTSMTKILPDLSSSSTSPKGFLILTSYLLHPGGGLSSSSALARVTCLTARHDREACRDRTRGTEATRNEGEAATAIIVDVKALVKETNASFRRRRWKCWCT